MEPPKDPVLAVRQLTKTYRNGDRELTVLKGVTFSLAAGATCAIVGPSGSGKTTLLGLCAGLDRATSGTVELAGQALEGLGRGRRARVRNEHTGFVFQNFQLVPTLTALENVMVPAELRGDRRRSTAMLAAHATGLLEQVGLADRQGHYPAQLSGGEQQRGGAGTGVREPARAPVRRRADGQPRRGNERAGHRADPRSHARAGTALVMVTHNLELAARTGRTIRLRDGAMVED